MNIKHLSHHIKIIALLSILWTTVVTPLAAQDTSSTRSDQRQHLLPVVISGQQPPSTTSSQTPVQVFDAEKIERSGATLLSDAVRQMAGVTLKDYGGIGGMKTVSARGLGSQFSTLTIDGVAVNDCQNGQVDLSRYLVGNSAYISLNNGQQDEMLLSARAVAAGSIINMETQLPTFLPGERTHIGIGLETGSFGLLSPTLSLQRRVSDRLFVTFWGNYIRSDGNYPFTLYYTQSHEDSSSVERRQNSQMWLATADMNLIYRIAPNRSLTAKAHYVQGFHALPGAVIFYNVERAYEDTKEKLFFSQVKYRALGSKLSFQLVGKYQFSSDLYENFNATTIDHYLKNEYAQHEGYMSASLLWRMTPSLSASFASDGAVASLHSNLTLNNDVERLSSLNTLSLQYKRTWMSIKANILGTLVSEQACDHPETIHYRRLSPYIGMNVKPFRKSEMRVRYFFKENYRVPNFNEMYYFTIPRDLKPERAMQHNFGVTLPVNILTRDSSQIEYTLIVDGYRNLVRDKIVAVPAQNMFLWSMMNLGRVDVTGVDIQNNIEWKRNRFSLSASLTYTYQHTVDHTNPADDYYGHQIAYTPRHSGGVTIYFETPWVNMGYNCLLVGERYYKQQNSSDTRLAPYADQGITFDRSFELPIGDLRLQFQLLNLFDVQYEVVRSYPMMGRNFRVRFSLLV